MSAGFTPGPWEVHTSGLVRRCEGDFCCGIAETRIPYRKGVSHSRGFKEEWHNARLIAAAPTMYLALENILSWTDEDATAAAVRDALAKARGDA